MTNRTDAKLISQLGSLLVPMTAFFSVEVLASEAGHAVHFGPETIKLMGYQSINLGILLFGLFYFTSKMVRDALKAKHAGFLKSAESAMNRRAEAEASLESIRRKLAENSSQRKERLLRAEAEAADLKKQILIEAQAQRSRFEKEVLANMENEIERAKDLLRIEMVDDATELARSQLIKRVSQEDHKRLNGDFLMNVNGGHQ